MSLTFVLACTPKVTEQTQETPKPQGKPLYSDDPCAKFSDSKAGDNALDAHVIYRDFLRNKDYKQAIPYWRRAFKAAPAADGKRQTHFEDGVDIYDYFLNQQSTREDKLVYLDSIMYMYDRMGKCYHEGGYIDGRKGFDLYYKYRDLVSDQEIFEFFSRSVDTDSLETHAFVINPFTALLVEMYNDDKIDQGVAVKYAKKILEITRQHEDDKENGWPVVVNYAPFRMDVFETVRGFFGCEYYINKYYEGVDVTAIDCEEIFLLQSRLKWGGCSVDSPEYASLEAEYQKRCAVTPVGTGPLSRARDALEEGRYQDAVNHYLEYLENASDPALLAKYNLRIAKIYYGHLKSFSRARQYAYEALDHRPDWGEPYLLIGKLYASSGPLCGPGRGWDSQIVTWPAIDKFQQAKRVDPSVTAEANKWIDYYSRYMPSIEDIFQRQLNEGDPYTVGCWIQERTTIRAAPRF